MDDGLVPLESIRKKALVDVLILVVVDDGLVPSGLKAIDSEIGRLNPCCSGRWSSTEFITGCCIQLSAVLILVVVDDGLVQLLKSLLRSLLKTVLILVVVDDGLVLDLIRHY